LQLRPDDAVVHKNKGSALHVQGKAEEAVACFQQAIVIRPGYAEAYKGLGSALRSQGKMEEALAYLEEALRVDPAFADGHVAYAFALLQAGDFERGWPELEWRWRCKDRPTAPVCARLPAWDGSPLDGRTILLWAEQGLGDALQFIRYAPLVAERGGRVAVACPASLHSLIRTCPGVDQVLVTGTPTPPFDTHAPLMSLPYLLGTTLATIPAEVPYLTAESALVEQWRGRLREVPQAKVGIVWQGNAQNKGDPLRSVPLHKFAPLARHAGVHLFGLQVGPGREQLQSLGRKFCVTDLGGWLDPNSLRDLAAILKTIDLLVTVDTAPAHLAGALGVPVWLALPFASEWRWLRDRQDSPWYPSMRLFRQSRAQDWDEVMERMAAELANRA
jgi:hypothetical protein